MFKTAYNAMFQNIAPTETVCRQVLSVMQEEEAKQMPTILPVKKAKDHRQVWTLVACAAVVLVAVALTATLMRDEKPPMLPAGVTTTVTETTAIITTTTTVENEIVPPPSTDTSAPTQSTTVAPTTNAPTEPDRPSTTTSTTVSPSTSISTMKPADDYDELFQWVHGFTTEAPAKDDPFPSASSNASTTDSPNTTTRTDFSEAPTVHYPEAEDPTAQPTQLPTTEPPITAAPTLPGYKDFDDVHDWIHNPEPFGGGVLNDEKTTSNTVQLGDHVIGRLQNNSVSLALLDSAEPVYLSTTKPPLINNIVVKEFALYGDRMVIICGSELVKNASRTRLFVYDISNPAAPRFLQEFGQDGQYLAAHRVEDTLYVMSYYVPGSGINPNKPDSFIPRLYQQGKTTLLLSNQIVPANHPTCNGYTVLTAISLSGQPAHTGAAALFGQNNSYTSIFDTSMLIGSKPYAVSPPTPNEAGLVTDLVQVVLDKGSIYLSSCTTLKGEAPLTHFTGKYYYVLLNESRPDGEHPWNVTDRHLYVLDRRLKTIGKLEHFWEGSPGRLHFTDDALYGLGSKRYTVDLRDPTKPTLTPRKELDMGTSLLHALEGGRLLTLQGEGNIVVSIVDEQWNYLYRTEGNSNFIGEPQEGLLIFLDRVYTYDAATGFTVEAETDFNPHTRECVATDRTLYLIEKDRILVYDRTDNYRFIGELKK